MRQFANLWDKMGFVVSCIGANGYPFVKDKINSVSHNAQE